MAYFLFADERHDSLLPFTYTRNAFDLRCGIFTFAERWREALGGAPAILPHLHLKELYPAASYAGTHIWINGLTIPTPEMLRLLTEIPPGTYAHGTDGLVYAAHMALDSLPAAREGLLTREWFAASGLKAMQVELPPMPTVTQLPDLFRLNAEMIRFDFPFATAKASSEKITDPHTRLYGADNIYVAPGVQVKAAIIDAENGPVYLGPNVQIQPGAVIQHTHAFGPNSVVNVGAKLRGDSSFGPYVKVGGEIGNSVIMATATRGMKATWVTRSLAIGVIWGRTPTRPI
ncbi:MAG: putative sugar nucleotidyl transferase [Bacteroidota bacterium]